MVIVNNVNAPINNSYNYIILSTMWKVNFVFHNFPYVAENEKRAHV